jgi:hypothetical protein
VTDWPLTIHSPTGKAIAMTLIHNPGNISEVFGDDGKRLAVFVGADAREKANAFFWSKGKTEEPKQPESR